MAVRLQPTEGAVHRGAIHARVGHCELLGLAGKLIAVGFAQSGEREQHDRLTEAVEVPHLTGAGGPLWMSSVAVSVSALHIVTCNLHL